MVPEAMHKQFRSRDFIPTVKVINTRTKFCQTNVLRSIGSIWMSWGDIAIEKRKTNDVNQNHLYVVLFEVTVSLAMNKSKPKTVALVSEE